MIRILFNFFFKLRESGIGSPQVLDVLFVFSLNVVLFGLGTEGGV